MPRRRDRPRLRVSIAGATHHAILTCRESAPGRGTYTCWKDACQAHADSLFLGQPGSIRALDNPAPSHDWRCLRAIASVAHAPHLEGDLIGDGFFYRRKGTIWQNANAQRVRHCSKSTHHVFCSAPMLYFEQCMTCLRQQARSKPAVISISRGEI